MRSEIESTPATPRGDPSSSDNPFEEFSREVRGAVEARLGRLLDERLEEATSLGPSVRASLEALRGLCVRGGKRWRAALIAAAYAGCGGVGGPGHAVMAGVAIELLQAYLLVHDDWMDGDEVRRGGPSVHVALARHFSSDSLGAVAAILVGDHASALAQEALLSVPVSAERLLDAAREFALLQREVTLGQMLDVLGAAPGLDATYTLKTGSYTVRGPLMMGAALAGASSETKAALERYSAPLGIAFQLRDDLLGAFGDPKATGKPRGSDLLKGKRTSLVVEMEADPRSAALLARVLGVEDAPPEELEAVTARMETSGARERVELKLRTLLAQAVEVLEHEAVGRELRRILIGAAQSLGHRER